MLVHIISGNVILLLVIPVFVRLGQVRSG